MIQVGNYCYCLGYSRTFVHATNKNGGSLNVISDVFLVKIKLDGTLVWAKNMGKTTGIAGNTATDGNEIGYRLAPSGQGGVVLMARINAGQNTKQESGIIWVDADGKTRWANQYNLSSHANNNELTFSIWKDGPEGYITGGYASIFSTPTSTRGMMYKVDQDGDIKWCKSLRCTGGIFESHFYGYYNHKTGKNYTTDYFSQTTGTIREMQVCTNKAIDGSVSTGSVPKAKRYYYGTANSSTNTFRSLIFPVGDGYENFIIAGNNINAAAVNTTKYTNILYIDEELQLQWAKKVGVEHDPGGLSPGFLNLVYDAVPCDDSGSFIAIGTLSKSNGHKHVLVVKIGESSELEDCEVTASVNQDSLIESATDLTLTKINLNSGDCVADTCWADNRLIPNDSVVVSTLTDSVIVQCSIVERGQGSGGNPENDELNNIVPKFEYGPIGLSNLSFEFLKEPTEVYFELTDITGDYVYERFWGNLDILKQGIKIESIGLLKGEYSWEIIAKYEDVKEIERKVEQFKMQ